MNTFKFNHKGKQTIELASYLKKPKVYITLLAYKKMKAYIEECAQEIGWLGKIRQSGDREFVLEDTFLFKQEVHAATCEITAEGLSEFIMGLYDEYDDDTAMDISNSIQLWGHSHVRMSTSPSLQDVNQLNSFKDCGHDCFIGVIGNKQGDLTFTLQDYTTGIVIKDLDWELYIPELHDETIVNEVKEEIAQKVTLKTVTYSTYGNKVTYAGGPYAGGLNSPNTHRQTRQLQDEWDAYLDDSWFNSRKDLIETEKVLIDDPIEGVTEVDTGTLKDVRKDVMESQIKEIKDTVEEYIEKLPKNVTKKKRKEALKELDKITEMLPILLENISYGDLIDCADMLRFNAIDDINEDETLKSELIDCMDLADVSSIEDEDVLIQSAVDAVNFLVKYIELF